MRYEELDPWYMHSKSDNYSNTLYELCKKNKIPFHLWFLWLDRQMFLQYQKQGKRAPREVFWNISDQLKFLLPEQTVMPTPAPKPAAKPPAV
jgi:hypothetical protein